MCTSTGPSGRGQKRQMLKTVKSCWPVNNDGLHTPSRTTVVFQKLPLGHDGEGRNTTALGLEVMTLTFCWFWLNWSPSPALTIPESSSKSNSMFMCRHVVSEYFYLFVFFVLHLDCFLGATFRQLVVRFVSSIHWAPCCFEVPVWVTAVTVPWRTRIVLLFPVTEALR